VTKKHQMTELDTSALAGMPVGISRSPLPLDVPDARRARRCLPSRALRTSCGRVRLQTPTQGSSRAIYREEPSLSGTAPKSFVEQHGAVGGHEQAKYGPALSASAPRLPFVADSIASLTPHLG